MEEIIKPVLDQYDPKTGKRYESEECPDLVYELDAVMTSVPRKFYVNCLPIDLPAEQSKLSYDTCMPLVSAGFKFDVLIVDSIIGSVFAGLTTQVGQFNEDGSWHSSGHYAHGPVSRLIQPSDYSYSRPSGTQDLIVQAKLLDQKSTHQGFIPAVFCPVCFAVFEGEVSAGPPLQAKFGFFGCNGSGKQLIAPNRGCRQYLYSFIDKEEMLDKVECLVPDRRVLF